jgi:hypothetical protein
MYLNTIVLHCFSDPLVIQCSLANFWHIFVAATLAKFRLGKLWLRSKHALNAMIAQVTSI